jgi:ketosteroid isomerase-like protein
LSDDLAAIRSGSDGVRTEGDVVSNLATVQSIYEAFGKGDVPAILNVLADDVEWESWADNSVNAGVPWMVPRRGKAEVVKFFEATGQMDIVDLKVLDMMESGNQVAVEFVLVASLPAWGEATTATKRCTCGPSTTRARSHAFVTTPTRQSTSPPTSNS